MRLRSRAGMLHPQLRELLKRVGPRRKLGFAGIAAKLLSAMPRKTQPRRVGFRLAKGVPDEDSMGPLAPYQEAVGFHLLDRAKSHLCFGKVLLLPHNIQGTLRQE